MKLTEIQKEIYENLIDVEYFEKPHDFKIKQVHKRMHKKDKNFRISRVEAVIKKVRKYNE